MEANRSSIPLLRQFKQYSTGLEFFWEDGLRSKASFWWLRDHDPGCRHKNGQKLTTTLDWPEILLPDQVSQVGQYLEIIWAGDHHTSLIHESLLREQAIEGVHGNGQIIWNRMLQPEICFFELEAVMSDSRARLEWLETVSDYGFAGLSGIPPEPGQIEEVVSWIGPIRETNFGRVFDIKSKPNPANLSDTHFSLPPRTENPYRDPPPGLHVVFCLEAAARGGDIILVDGSFVLRKVLKHNPLGYQLLSEIPVRFQYRDDQVWLEHERCLVERKPDGSLQSLVFNNRSVDPFSLPGTQQVSWYKAYRSLEREFLSSQNQLEIPLKPGQMLVIDNRRVLHGQTSFSAYSNRHLLGCYLEHDALSSEIRMLREQLGQRQ